MVELSGSLRDSQFAGSSRGRGPVRLRLRQQLYLPSRVTQPVPLVRRSRPRPVVQLRHGLAPRGTWQIRRTVLSLVFAWSTGAQVAADAAIQVSRGLVLPSPNSGPRAVGVFRYAGAVRRIAARGRGRGGAWLSSRPSHQRGTPAPSFPGIPSRPGGRGNPN